MGGGPNDIQQELLQMDSDVISYKLGSIESKIDQLVIKYDERESDTQKRLNLIETWRNKQDAKVNWVLGASAVLGVIGATALELFKGTMIHG